ncbi:hypothetical protein OBBRIDRAFT_805368 [Obba rivulosa]|uniref:Uncharacterized protein n=1 Tax=Obba rivulosa TaxID=1052685 RepID=A0A8E2DIP7_9APHY|nr:hypothetical protein OBBRIDRAFT_805368 [Obba rivulosa]
MTFLANMLALSRQPSALHNLREISIGVKKDDTQQHRSKIAPLVSLLTGVLGRAVYLESLRISPADSVLIHDRDGGLQRAICALPYLKTLVLREASERAGTLLNGISSGITELALHTTGTTAGQDAAPYLNKFWSTLVTVQLYRTDLRAASTIFPRLKRLLLEETHVRDVRPLIVAFPEVLELRFEAALGNTKADEGKVETTRAENRAAQVNEDGATEGEQVSFGHTWPGLEHVQGDIESLYMLGLRCPIRNLYLHTLTTWNQGKLRALLDDGLPEFLSVDIVLRDYYIHKLHDMIPAHAFLPMRLRLTLWFKDYTRDASEVALYSVCSSDRQSRTSRCSSKTFR